MANRRLYPTPESLAKRVDKYFREEENKPYTGYGLQRFLNFQSHHSFSHYRDKKGFREILEQAFTRIGEQHEKNLLSGKNCTGSIFWLKSNNFNNDKWVEKQEIVHDGELKVSVKISGTRNIDLDKL